MADFDGDGVIIANEDNIASIDVTTASRHEADMEYAFLMDGRKVVSVDVVCMGTHFTHLLIILD